MKKYLKYISIILIILLLIFIYLTKTNEYSTNLFYMDTYISIKINDNNKNKVKRAFKEAENLYKTYHNLTDRYNKSSQLYLINHTKDKTKIDKELYNLIKYSYDWYFKTDGLFNINMGSIIDVWAYYRDNKKGIPDISELQFDNNIDNIILLDNNEIINKGNIDLGGIVKGYVTKLVGECFEKIGIKDYIINAGGNVLVGKKTKDNYKIGIESPLKDGNIYQIVNGNNISVVTSGSYERFYEYEGQIYHHIINPNTLYPSNYMKSVTIISNDSALADILSTTLFLMPIEKGKEYLKKFNNVEAIWYDNNNNIIKTEGFSKYE